MRDRSGGVDAEAEAGGEDERAPVSSGAARWLAAEARGGENFSRRWRGGLFKGRLPVEESGYEQGGLPADQRAAPGRQRPKTSGHARRALCVHCRPNRGGGVRLTGGPRQQC
jgi:hypothetical protein